MLSQQTNPCPTDYAWVKGGNSWEPVWSTSPELLNREEKLLNVAAKKLVQCANAARQIFLAHLYVGANVHPNRIHRL